MRKLMARKIDIIFNAQNNDDYELSCLMDINKIYFLLLGIVK